MQSLSLRKEDKIFFDQFFILCSSIISTCQFLLQSQVMSREVAIGVYSSLFHQLQRAKKLRKTYLKNQKQHQQDQETKQLEKQKLPSFLDNYNTNNYKKYSSNNENQNIVNDSVEVSKSFNDIVSNCCDKNGIYNNDELMICLFSAGFLIWICSIKFKGKQIFFSLTSSLPTLGKDNSNIISSDNSDYFGNNEIKPSKNIKNNIITFAKTCGGVLRLENPNTIEKSLLFAINVLDLYDTLIYNEREDDNCYSDSDILYSSPFSSLIFNDNKDSNNNEDIENLRDFTYTIIQRHAGHPCCERAFQLLINFVGPRKLLPHITNSRSASAEFNISDNFNVDVNSFDNNVKVNEHENEEIKDKNCDSLHQEKNDVSKNTIVRQEFIRIAVCGNCHPPLFSVFTTRSITVFDMYFSDAELIIQELQIRLSRLSFVDSYYSLMSKCLRVLRHDLLLLLISEMIKDEGDEEKQAINVEGENGRNKFDFKIEKNDLNYSKLKKEKESTEKKDVENEVNNVNTVVNVDLSKNENLIGFELDKKKEIRAKKIQLKYFSVIESWLKYLGLSKDYDLRGILNNFNNNISCINVKDQSDASFSTQSSMLLTPQRLLDSSLTRVDICELLGIENPSDVDIIYEVLKEQ